MWAFTPTASHLKKANIDVNQGLKSFLFAHGILNVEEVPKGVEHKVILDLRVKTNGTITQETMSVYRTMNRGCRFWIHNLNEFLQQGDSLEFKFRDGVVMVTIIPRSSANRIAWTDHELQLCVESYVAMRKAIFDGQVITKKAVYESLSKLPAFSINSRSVKAIEYRFCNISTVVKSRGESTIPGLLPRDNVGRLLSEKINAILDELL